jgi:hypothetical protein
MFGNSLISRDRHDGVKRVDAPLNGVKVSAFL